MKKMKLSNENMAPKQQDICSFKVNTSTGNLISSWKKQQNTKKTQCYLQTKEKIYKIKLFNKYRY